MRRQATCISQAWAVLTEGPVEKPRETGTLMCMLKPLATPQAVCRLDLRSRPQAESVRSFEHIRVDTDTELKREKLWHIRCGYE